MIAGSLAILSQPADEPLENYHDSGFRAVEVETTQETLDGDTVQSGLVAGRVRDTKRRVELDGHSIDVEQAKTKRKEATEWIADVDGAGWIAAASTYPTEEDHLPPWPFSQFGVRTGREIYPVHVDVREFYRAQEDAGRETAVEFVGRETGSDGVSIEWGKGATQSSARDADVGVALTTFWNGEFVRVCVYQSGYIAVWEPKDWQESAFGRFVTEEVLEHTHLPPEDDDPGEQQTLGSSSGDSFKDDVRDHLEGEGYDVSEDVEVS